MKINKFCFNFQQDKPVCNEISKDYMLISAASPIVFTICGRDVSCPTDTIIIYDQNSYRTYCSADRNPLILDTVGFGMTSADRQFFSELNIPLNKPVQLGENIVIHNLVKSMHTQQIYYNNADSDFNDHALRMILLNISEQLRSPQETEIPDVPRYRELLKLRRSICASPTSRWSIDEICSEMNISRTYFHRIYFSAFGITCMQDIIENRLSFAAEMLISTDTSVSKIAEICGYDSDSYFMRQFKKHTGLTPLEYRRRFSCNCGK